MFKWNRFWKLSSISMVVKTTGRRWARRPASSFPIFFYCMEDALSDASHLGENPPTWGGFK